MRYIKFRAWDPENKEMLDIEKLFWENGELLIQTTMYVDYLELSDLILMQFIGLKDKNGKEIFEGDIVNIEYQETIVENAEIVNKGANFYAETNADDWELDGYCSIEIIGNKYERN